MTIIIDGVTADLILFTLCVFALALVVDVIRARRK